MTRLITPTPTPESKAECAQAIVHAAEMARQLHNALQAIEPRDVTRYRDEVAYGVARAAWKERLDAVGQLEGELLEHAMRVTLGC